MAALQYLPAKSNIWAIFCSVSIDCFFSWLWIMFSFVCVCLCLVIFDWRTDIVINAFVEIMDSVILFWKVLFLFQQTVLLLADHFAFQRLVLSRNSGFSLAPLTWQVSTFKLCLCCGSYCGLVLDFVRMSLEYNLILEKSLANYSMEAEFSHLHLFFVN